MEISLHQPKSALIIETYGPSGFKVSGEEHTGAIMLKAEVCAPWPDCALWPDCAALDDAALLAARDFMADCEVVLVGTGARARFMPPSQRTMLKDAGMKVEVMDTGAACRTYNVLLGDGRKVGALLLPDA